MRQVHEFTYFCVKSRSKIMMWNEVMYYYTWKYSHQYHCTITHSPTQVHSETHTHTHTHTFEWIKTKKRRYLFPYACMVMLNDVTSHNINIIQQSIKHMMQKIYYNMMGTLFLVINLCLVIINPFITMWFFQNIFFENSMFNNREPR